MKRIYTLLGLLGICCNLAYSQRPYPQKEPTETKTDTTFFCFLDSQLVVIPQKYILDRQEDKQFITLTLQGDTTFTLSKYALKEETNTAPMELPVIESFKFNNDMNDQLYSTAYGEIDNLSNTINLNVASIGKSLVASVKLPDEEDAMGTLVWVDGKRNISKKTRRRFDRDYTYTVARPRHFIYDVVKTEDEVWSTPPEHTDEPWIYTPVALNGDMLSTNWPSMDQDQRLELCLDGDPSTYFHSDWHDTNDWREGATYGDGETTWPYLQVELSEPLYALQFSYTTRNWDSNGGYAPQGFIILGSEDGKTWQEAATFGAGDLPVGASQSYTSPVIELGRSCRFVRFQLTASTRKNYLVLAEFGISKAEANPDYGKDKEDFKPEIISPAKYAGHFLPYGRDYRVHVNFLTQQSTAAYRIPRIDILFGDSVSWNSNTWIGRHGKSYYEEASIEIDGAGIYPDMPKTHLLIRGRGNSSWSNSHNSKNPYRLKFDEKVKPFGMTKGKSWVLLANKQGNSMTTNALAMKIADMVETDGCNHCIPVELYINGHYRGSYNFTEKVGLANNSINLADESKAALLELDQYYDEPYKFRDDAYNLYVNVKSPDFSDPEEKPLVTFEQIQNAFNNFTYTVKAGSFASKDPASSPLDVRSFVRAWLVNDLTRNTEMMHPKSWFVYTEDATDSHAPWHFGPVWDFDWSYGYEGTSTYFLYNAEDDIFERINTWEVGVPFFQQLVRDSEVVKKEYYRLWTQFMKEGMLEELLQYCDDYFAFVEPSFQHNATLWGDGKDYAATTRNAKSWLERRAQFIYTHLTAYDLGEDIVDPWENPGQPDGVLDAKPTGLTPVIDMTWLNRPVPVYNLQGSRVALLRPSEVNSHNLHPGIYIVHNKKIIIR